MFLVKLCPKPETNVDQFSVAAGYLTMDNCDRFAGRTSVSLTAVIVHPVHRHLFSPVSFSLVRVSSCT